MIKDYNSINFRNKDVDRLRQDTIQPKKTWQQMSVVEKGEKKKELVKKGGMERFQQYKDSVSKDATDRVNKQFEKNAATRGLTVEELRSANKKGKEVGLDNMGSGSEKGGDCKKDKGCSTKKIR